MIVQFPITHWPLSIHNKSAKMKLSSSLAIAIASTFVNTNAVESGLFKPKESQDVAAPQVLGLDYTYGDRASDTVHRLENTPKVMDDSSSSEESSSSEAAESSSSEEQFSSSEESSSEAAVEESSSAAAEDEASSSEEQSSSEEVSSFEAAESSSQEESSSMAVESTVTQEDISTTTITISSCDEESSCTEDEIITGVTTVTTTISGIITEYTTYCPIPTTEVENLISTMTISITSCDEESCFEDEITTGVTTSCIEESCTEGVITTGVTTLEANTDAEITTFEGAAAGVHAGWVLSAIAMFSVLLF